MAVVVARQGRLPAGADDTVAEAGGRVLVVGSGAEEAAAGLVSATRAWWAATTTEPACLGRCLAPVLESVPLVVLPASPDGRDLAPRLAAELGRPLLAGAVRVDLTDGCVRADLLRVDGQVVVPVVGPAPAIATLMPGVRAPVPTGQPAAAAPLELPALPPAIPPAVELLQLIQPDPATMDLADATRVLGGGAGLVSKAAGDEQAREVFVLLGAVAAALGASAGATRVVTDAGWTGHERQIGTTGVAVDPDLYVALGVSGASQHTGGLGSPRHIVSVNTDPACPMTAMADLGLVCDAAALLVELAGRLGVAVPGELDGVPRVPSGAEGAGGLGPGGGPAGAGNPTQPGRPSVGGAARG